MEQEKKSLTERLSSNKALLIVAVLLLGISVFVANFLLHFFQQVLFQIEDFAKNAEESSSFKVDWHYFFVFQKEWYQFYIGFYIIIGVILLKYFYNMRLNYRTINKGQHGTNEFESTKNVKKQYQIIPAKKKEYKGKGGTIIGGLHENKTYSLLIDDAPVHTMVIGITRSGKGETFVVPMIDVQSRASEKPSMVINDPKGELAGASYETLKKRGYDVYVFNLIEHSMSMGFNPLQLVVDAYKKGNVSDAQKYANSVAFSLYNEPNAKDPFWSNSAKSLVTAIILAIAEDMVAKGKEENVTMYTVANFLSTKGSDNDENDNNALDLFFKERSENNPARMMYATSNFATGNTRGSIFSVAMDKLQIFTLEPNAKVTSFNSLDLTEIGFGDKPIALFLATPDSDQSNDVLASIFVSQLYRVNSEKATKSPSGKMKRNVHFLLDEAGNMPAIDGLPNMVTVGAGRGFRIHLIIQAYPQMKALYGESAETIIGNCSNQIYILTADKSTAEHYSGMLNDKTISDVSRSGELFSFDKTHNESTKERALLKPDELMRLKEGQSVVIRVNKRQDKKRRKIEPKPIFNQKKTSHKFRYEYLAKDFDTDKSILSLPISTSIYHDIDLDKKLYGYKSPHDMYMPVRTLLTEKEYHKLSQDYKKLMKKTMGDNWSFMHVFSSIAYADNINPLFLQLMENKIFKKYVPEKEHTEWLEIADKNFQFKTQCENEESQTIPQNKKAIIHFEEDEKDIKEKIQKQIMS